MLVVSVPGSFCLLTPESKDKVKAVLDVDRPTLEDWAEKGVKGAREVLAAAERVLERE